MRNPTIYALAAVAAIAAAPATGAAQGSHHAGHPPPSKAEPIPGGGGEFVKPAPCAGCVLESRCFGLRRGYAQMYGWDELRPLTVPSEPDRALELSPAPP